MKKFWKSFVCLLEAFGRARAAGELARAGRHKEARQLMERSCECC